MSRVNCGGGEEGGYEHHYNYEVFKKNSHRNFTLTERMWGKNPRNYTIKMLKLGLKGGETAPITLCCQYVA